LNAKGYLYLLNLLAGICRAAGLCLGGFSSQKGLTGGVAPNAGITRKFARARQGLW
jgi:hypothetical protein